MTCPIDSPKDYSQNGHSGVIAPEAPAPVASDVQDLSPVEEPENSLPKRHFRLRLSKRVLALLGIGVLVAGGVGYCWWHYSATHEETDDATVAGNIDPVSSQVSGQISKIFVQDNQTVKPGELLVQLDPQTYQAKVAQAQAALVSAQEQAQAAQSTVNQSAQGEIVTQTQAQGTISTAIASIGSAQANLQAAKEGVPAAQAQLNKANADLQQAQADYQRYQTLYQEGAIAKQQLDSATATYKDAQAAQSVAQQAVLQAQAKLVQAQQGVAQAQAQLNASRAGLDQTLAAQAQTQTNQKQYQAAQAAIAQAQSQLVQAQLQLSYTRITAPASGYIGSKTAELGQQVQPGQELMAVVEPNPWVIANFKETQVDHMHPGETVTVQLDAIPSHTFTGHVDSLAPGSGNVFALLPPDNATGNFTKVVQRIPVKIDLDAQSVQGYQSQITPGTSAEVSVNVQ